MTRLEEIKKNKPFAIWDLVIYGVLLALILTLFGVFVFGGKGKPASGIQITDLDGKTVYVYIYGNEKGDIAADWNARIEEKTEDGLLVVTVYHDEARKKFNVLEIDSEKKTASMRDANCSFHKDCVKMKSISTERDIIVCLPYHIKICALGGEKEDLFHPSVG